MQLQLQDGLWHKAQDKSLSLGVSIVVVVVYCRVQNVTILEVLVKNNLELDTANDKVLSKMRWKCQLNPDSLFLCSLKSRSRFIFELPCFARRCRPVILCKNLLFPMTVSCNSHLSRKDDQHSQTHQEGMANARLTFPCNS